MTRAEYLEFAEESMGFAATPEGLENVAQPFATLRDTPEVCTALREAHRDYCKQVEYILFPERRR